MNKENQSEPLMSYGLNIHKNGELYFLSLGALVEKLDPGIVPFRKATEYQVHVSGQELDLKQTALDELSN